VLLLEERLKRKRAETFPEATTADEYFLLSSIDTVLRSRDLSYQEIERGITEGRDDGGIDAVYTFLNGKLVEDELSCTVGDRPRIELEVVQVKNEDGFKETAIQKLIDHLPLLVRAEQPPDLDIEFNERLRERFEVFRQLCSCTSFASIFVRVWYITRAVDSPHTKVQKKASRLSALVADELSGAEVLPRFIGAQELNIEARRRTTLVLKLQAIERPLSAEKGGLVCLVSLRDWYNFISGEDGSILESIFEENVRGFVGNTRINRSIARSLSEGDDSSADFWWLNNGVTVLGRRVESRHRTLTIEDPQVVNGLQTSRSIYQHFRSLTLTPAAEGSGRHLLVRVIQADDDDLSSKIIRATNSQNKIDGGSLRATEPLQRDIEEYFTRMGYYYERRKNHYKSAGVTRDKLIEVLEVAQAMAAILLCEPHVSRGQPSALVRDPRYAKIFDSKTPLGAYTNATFIVRRVDRYLVSAHPGLSRQARSNVRFQLARVAAAFALAAYKPKPAALAYLEPELFTDDRLDPVYEWTLERRRAAESATRNADQNVLAKSAEWSRQIDEQLEYFSSKNRWPTAIPSAWGKG
jgi:hypothetical protein